MDLTSVASVVGVIASGLAGLASWITLRERVVRAETKIETLESLHKDQKTEVQSLREWLDSQFIELRKSLERKADR